MSGCKQATTIGRGGLTATAEQHFYSAGATRRIVLRVAVVYVLVTFFSTVPAEGLSFPSWAQNNCNKTEYFDHGTAHCESCCDICCFAKIKGTAETCGRKCPGKFQFSCLNLVPLLRVVVFVILLFFHPSSASFFFDSFSCTISVY